MAAVCQDRPTAAVSEPCGLLRPFGFVDLAVDRRLVAVGAHRGPLQSGATSGEPVLRPRQALVGTVEHPERILGMRGGA
jgi:hypothetical protein